MTKILVVGTGAIGGFYAGKLAQAGAEISVLCRSDYDAVKKSGITIESYWGDFHFSPKKVLRNLSEYNEKADFILVATKVLPEISLPNLLAPVLNKNTSIVLLQNGIHIEKPIADSFPNHHLISVIAFVGVAKIAAAKINHQEYGRLIIGDFPSGVSSKTLQLVELLRKSQVPVEISENIQIERWKKLVWNAPFNPISVIAGGLNTKEMLDNSEIEKLARNVMQEVCLLAEADGFKLPENISEKTIDLTHQMKPYKTSMLLDFEAKRPMEIEAILGNAILFAQKKSIATPYLSGLYSDLKNLQNHQ
jgi:2-dehydropantoate 2-reductase